MFEIEYKGANAVIFTTKKNHVIFDPKLSVVGLKDISVHNAVEVTTEERFTITDPKPKVLFDGPGEYEIGDIALTGVAAIRHIDTETNGQQATVYRLTAGDIRTAVIGNIAPKLSDQQLEDIGVVDLVVIPIGGGGYTLDATSAVAMIRQLDPRVVIPVHYADPAISYAVEQEELDVFTKELGAIVIEAGSKWKIKGIGSLPEVLTIMKIDRS